MPFIHPGTSWTSRGRPLAESGSGFPGLRHGRKNPSPSTGIVRPNRQYTLFYRAGKRSMLVSIVGWVCVLRWFQTGPRRIPIRHFCLDALPQTAGCLPASRDAVSGRSAAPAVSWPEGFAGNRAWQPPRAWAGEAVGTARRTGDGHCRPFRMATWARPARRGLISSPGVREEPGLSVGKD